MLFSPDNLDPSDDSATPPKTPLPFSMSGDGMEDVDIPSVFMKKADVESLMSVVRLSLEAVVVKLAPKPTKDEGESGKLEGAEPKEVLRLETAAGQTVEEVSEQLQKLLEGLDPEVLTDKLKESVAEELQKLKNLNSDSTANAADVVEELKTLNSGQNVADSASMAEELLRRTLNSRQSDADSGNTAEEENSESCVDSTRNLEKPLFGESKGELRTLNSRLCDDGPPLPSAEAELPRGSKPDG